MHPRKLAEQMFDARNRIMRGVLRIAKHVHVEVREAPNHRDAAIRDLYFMQALADTVEQAAEIIEGLPGEAASPPAETPSPETKAERKAQRKAERQAAKESETSTSEVVPADPIA